MRFISFTVLGRRIKALKQFLSDRTVPKRKKLLVVFGIIYLFLPIDIIPEPVLGVGLIDDIVLWVFILTCLSDELDRYWKESEEGPQEEARVDAGKAYKGKTIIETTGREVDDSSADDR